VNNNTVSLENAKLGKQELTATIYHDGKIEKNSTSITILSDKAPVVYTYKVINEYPHDQKAFTQGLEFHNDTLYESTGKKGESSLRKVDYKTGKVLQQVNLNAAYFGEGITIMDDKIYQLTWQEGTGFIYDLKT